MRYTRKNVLGLRCCLNRQYLGQHSETSFEHELSLTCMRVRPGVTFDIKELAREVMLKNLLCLRCCLNCQHLGKHSETSFEHES